MASVPGLFVRLRRPNAPTHVFGGEEQFARVQRYYESVLDRLSRRCPPDLLENPERFQTFFGQTTITASEKRLLQLALQRPSMLSLAAAMGRDA